MKKLLLLCIVVLTASCASEPTIDTSAEAELSFDGLVPISHSRFAQAWADPDIDLTTYDKVILGGAEFEFRAVREGTGTARARSSATEFWISDANKQRLIDEVTAVFQEQLQQSQNFTVVEEAGPDVLILVGAMHDIVSRVPPQQAGRTEVFLSSVGEATLIIEARDSQSGETIWRAVDRRAMDQGGSATGGIRVNSVTAWSEVRRLARRWATRLVEGLDSIHE